MSFYLKMDMYVANRPSFHLWWRKYKCVIEKSNQHQPSISSTVLNFFLLQLTLWSLIISFSHRLRQEIQDFILRRNMAQSQGS